MWIDALALSFWRRQGSAMGPLRPSCRQ